MNFNLTQEANDKKQAEIEFAKESEDNKKYNEDSHTTNMKTLNDEIKRLNDELVNNLTANHDKKELSLLKEFQRAENQLGDKLKEYDDQMAVKNDSLDKITKNYNDVKEDLQMI